MLPVMLFDDHNVAQCRIWQVERQESWSGSRLDASSSASDNPNCRRVREHPPEVINKRNHPAAEPLTREHMADDCCCLFCRAALAEEAIVRARQAEIVAQRLALIVAPKQTARLQFRH